MLSTLLDCQVTTYVTQLKVSKSNVSIELPFPLSSVQSSKSNTPLSGRELGTKSNKQDAVDFFIKDTHV